MTLEQHLFILGMPHLPKWGVCSKVLKEMKVNLNDGRSEVQKARLIQSITVCAL